MSVSLEVRALHVSDTTRDLIVTSAHLPENSHLTQEAFLTRSLDIPPGLFVRRSDLSSFWEGLPKHIQSDFPSEKHPWLQSDVAFLERTVKMQMLGSFQHATFPSVGFYKGIPYPHDPLSRVLDWHYRGMRKGSSNEVHGIARVELLATILMHLDGMFVSVSDVPWSDSISETVSSYEIPLSQSPGIEGVTLKDLAQKGIQAVCLFPLVAGVYAGVQHLSSGECGMAIQIASSGGGMTIVAFSTLWIADKIFGNVKHLAPSQDSTKKKGKRQEG